MEIPLSISNRMAESARAFLEDQSVRVPRDLRDLLDVEVGQFMSFRTLDDRILSLQIMPAFEEDLFQDSTVAYVTPATHALLVKEDNSAELKIVEGITLGCDPEFFLVATNGDIVHPGRFFRKYHQLGYDGMLAEIRPLPALDEYGLTDNIGNLLAEADQKMRQKGFRDIRMLAASHYKGLTAGFHLHFGLPAEVLGVEEIKKRVLSQIVRALDYYVAIPGVIHEGIKDSQRRCAAFLPYGKVGDFRMDHRTLEYRVAGGALLKHPVLTRGLIALGATVVEDAISRIKHCTNDFQNLENMSELSHLQDLYPNVPTAYRLYQLCCVPDSHAAKDELDIIVEDVSTMVGFNKRRTSVLEFFDALEHDFSPCLRSNWLSQSKSASF